MISELLAPLPTPVRRAAVLLGCSAGVTLVGAAVLLLTSGVSDGCYPFPGCAESLVGLSGWVLTLLVALVLAAALVAVVRGYRRARGGVIAAALLAVVAWVYGWDPAGAVPGLGGLKTFLCWVALAWYILLLVWLYRTESGPWFRSRSADASAPAVSRLVLSLAKALAVAMGGIAGLLVLGALMLTLGDLSNPDAMLSGLGEALAPFALVPAVFLGSLALLLWRRVASMKPVDEVRAPKASGPPPRPTWDELRSQRPDDSRGR